MCKMCTSGKPSCRTCFVGDTVVFDTKSNELKEIKDIEGSLVSGELKADFIKITYSNGEQVVSTANHGAFANGDMIFGCMLSGLMQDTSDEATQIQVVSVEEIKLEPQLVYNLDLKGEPIYVTKSMLKFCDMTSQEALNFIAENNALLVE